MAKSKNKAIVLGISANGLGIARSLGRRGIDVIVVSDTDTSVNLRSRYISDQCFFYGNDTELVEEMLKRGPSFSEKPALFPIRDATVLALAERIDEIKKYYLIVMPPLELVKNALCKTSFAKMAESFGLPVPKSFSIGRDTKISDLPFDIKFPVIVKPEYRNDRYVAHVSGKAFKAGNLDELYECYKNFSTHQEEAIIQEYIPGEDSDLFFCFQYYTTGHSLACSLTGRKIRQYPSLCGSTSSCEVFYAPKIEELTSSFFTRIGYVGPCSMEFKRDPRDGTYYFIEPTIGRHDWNNAFGEGNGLPMPYINYLDAVGGSLSHYKQKKIARRWIRWSADFETSKEKMKQGDLSIGGWLKSIRPPVTGAIFAIDDLLPSIVNIKNKILKKGGKVKKIIKKKLRKIILIENYIVLSKKDLIDNNFDSEELFFKEASKEDVNNIALQYGEHFGKNAAQEIEKKMSDGEILIVGSFSRDFKDICYMAWLSCDDNFFNVARDVLKLEKAICLYRIYVPDSHRNKGIGEYALSYIENTFLKNYKQILAFVHIKNAPSLAMFKKRKWKNIGRLYRVRIFGKEIIKVSLR